MGAAIGVCLAAFAVWGIYVWIVLGMPGCEELDDDFLEQL